MSALTRRRYLAGVAGAATAAAFGGAATEPTAADSSLDTSLTDDISVETARYVGKHARERATIYRDLTAVFDPPTDEDLTDLFEESITPSVAALLPGIVGDAFDLVETLEWYEQVHEDSGFRRVITKGVDPESFGGRGQATSAADELRELADNAESVQAAAEDYVSAAGDSEAVVDALRAERATIADARWVREWAKINPSSYDATPGPGAGVVEAAERLKANAKAVVAILEATNQALQAHIGGMSRSTTLPFPSLVAMYNADASSIQERIPSSLLNRYAGDDFNVYIETANGDTRSANWLDSTTDATLKDYELTERSGADADVYVPESVIEKAIHSTDPAGTMLDAYDGGEIRIDGNGIGNTVKYDGVSVAWSVADTAKDVFDTVTDLF